MASVNGFSIENVKEWTGHEGECYSGDLLLNGKKICHWAEDGNGGCNCYEWCMPIDSRKLNDAIRSTRTAYYSYECSPPLDDLIAELVVLSDTEKTYQENEKGEYTLLVVVETYDLLSIFFFFQEKNIPDEQVIQDCKGVLAEGVSENEGVFENGLVSENDIMRIDIFHSLNDFTRGKNVIQLENIIRK